VNFRLVPGELVDVKITLDTLKDAVVVPRVAVNNGQDGLYSWVIGEDMKAEMRPIKVLYQNQSVAALGSGVERGERVVVDGQLRLNPGVTVMLAGEGAPPGAAEGNNGNRTRGGQE
jgi:multidrug efflux system membrane fusion protein